MASPRPPVSKTSNFLYRVRLLVAAENDRAYHGFNRGGHLLSGDAVGGLKPAAGGPEDGPGRHGRQHCRIDTGCEPMTGNAVVEHPLDDWNDGAFKRDPSQLTGTACVLSEIVADAQRNGAQCSMAVGKGDGASLHEVAETGVCHRPQKRVLVRIVEVEGGPVQRRLVGDLLDRDVFKLLFNQ